MPKDLSVQQSVQTLFKRGKGGRKAGTKTSTKTKSTREKKVKPKSTFTKKGWLIEKEYDFMYGKQHLEIDKKTGLPTGVKYAIGGGAYVSKISTKIDVGMTEYYGSVGGDYIENIAPQHRIQHLSSPIAFDIFKRELTAYGNLSRNGNLSGRLHTQYDKYIRETKGPGRRLTQENWLKQMYASNPELLTGGLTKQQFDEFAQFVGGGSQSKGEKILYDLTPSKFEKIVSQLQELETSERLGDVKGKDSEKQLNYLLDFVDYRTGRMYSNYMAKLVEFRATPQPGSDIFKEGKYSYPIKYYKDETTTEIGKAGIDLIYSMLKEKHPGIKITKKDVETAIKNAQDLNFIVKAYNMENPNVGGPDDIMSALDFLGLAALKPDLKFPGIGDDVLEFEKRIYLQSVSREDIENATIDKYIKKQALDLFDKQGYLDEGQIAYLNRVTRGLIGALKPPTSDDLMENLKNALRRQIPRIQIRMENWFKAAQKEFNGSDLLPIVYDLASRVADSMGYPSLFEPGSEINLWYHNWGPDDNRIMSLISSLEHTSGLKADWGMLAENAEDYDTDDDKTNQDIFMAYNYFIERYGSPFNFPDFLYEYFEEQGLI